MVSDLTSCLHKFWLLVQALKSSSSQKLLFFFEGVFSLAILVFKDWFTGGRMVGGEREQKRKRTLDPGRMRDPKRPKPSKAVLRAAAEQRDGLTILSESTSAFVLCPFDGAKLQGKDKKCPTCFRGGDRSS
jgi:hypothetical protein